jgi:hypothetical protein
MYNLGGPNQPAPHCAGHDRQLVGTDRFGLIEKSAKRFASVVMAFKHVLFAEPLFHESARHIWSPGLWLASTIQLVRPEGCFSSYQISCT